MCPLEMQRQMFCFKHFYVNIDLFNRKMPQKTHYNIPII